MSFEREVFQSFITNNAGDVQPNAQVTVWDAGTNDLSTIYDSLTGGQKSNPFNTGSDGLARFYAEPGRYRVQAQTSSGIAVFDDVDLSQKSLRADLADEDSEVLIAGFPARDFNEKINELQGDFDTFINESQQDVDDFINNNQTEINRLQVIEKVKRDATLYLDFAKNEGSERVGLGIERTSALNLIDYTCPDPATGETPIGTIETVGVNEPRFVSREGVSQGLLVEPASTNLILWSEDFSQSEWQVTQSTLQSVIASPINSGEAFKLVVDDGQSPTNPITQDVSISSGTYSTSIYLKADEVEWVRLVFAHSTGTFSTYFNMIDGSFGVGNAEPYDVYFLTNGWVRVSFVLDIPESGTFRFRIRSSEGEGVSEFTGDGVSGFYLTGAQLEQGFPTSYIPTEGSAVTRGVGLATSSPIKINKTATSFYAETVNLIPASTFWRIFQADENGDVNNALQLTDDLSDFGIMRPRFRITKNGDFKQARSGNIPSEDLIPLNKWLAGFDKSNGRIFLYRNGVLVAEFVGDFEMPDVNGIGIFSGVGSVEGRVNGTMRRLDIIPYALTDAEAIALTTLEDE